MKRMRHVYVFFIVATLCGIRSYAQVDTLVFSNANMIIGEIKSMDRGVLTVETKYSDKDFEIEWRKIQEIYTQTQFLITLSKNENIYFGRLTTSSDLKVIIVTNDGVLIESSFDDIVNLEPIEEKFKDRFSASVSIGLDMAKANNLRTLTTRIGLGYKADRWATDAFFNTLRSKQDESDQIQRSDGELNYRYIFPKGWYGIATFSTLSNTEQKLDLRINAQLGLGIFLIRTNKSYWGTKLGANRNFEQYSNETTGRNSWEGFMGTELNLYDVGDFSLQTILIAYPGITEKGRWRFDSNLDIKYDLPLDFYIKLGVSMNYDNRPAEDASETDYVLQTGFGWEW